MLRITSCPIASKSIFIYVGCIEMVRSGNLINKINIVDEASIVRKANIRSLKSEIGFFIYEARLVFAK